ncbi:hypothetical protein [uncultured Draconibacterium sp.]|uniref:hypothetical protein n=1 Tax=uncultured Draconibacterium sp. TaxID=1573823 RepID=UPI002AA5F570|nr:hypothetical protein [uncultured Draconibacterium sp.]
MKLSIRFFIVVISFAIFISCDKDGAGVVENNKFYDSNLTLFKSNFLVEYEGIDYSNIQDVNSVLTKSSSDSNYEAITFPVMYDGKIVGRYIGLKDQTSAIYIDMSDYTKTITVYNVINPEQYEVVGMVYDSFDDTYIPNTLKSASGFWCGVACGLGTVAIAASDGPVPVMDVLAASYAVACLASCLE